MKINEIGVAAKSIDARTDVHATSSASGSGIGAAGAAAAVSDASTFVLSPEIRRWLNVLRDQPEVRLDMIKKASEKLANGHYASSETADQLADALLKAID